MEKYIVKLTMEERESLLSLINRGKASAKKLTHARILLAADESVSRAEQQGYERIAQELHVSTKTVERVRQRFVEEGLESALNRKEHSRSRPRIIQGDEEAHLVAIACSSAPQGRARWTLKLLADEMVALEVVEAVSVSTIGRALKKTN